ncbi:CNNM domain-containing protein [Desulfogranum marinum]|uniref:DUF21 domain-containing protein n=1 Tax=Desulfogranum marinum TaxID=453220 RepID=UPI0029C70E5E|nr:CNNM domain-containing protein [Desulfogranum marinum]
MNMLTWLGIFFCISQSAMFSGLNLAFFSISRLRLEVEKGQNNKAAAKVLEMRNDSNFLLTTILWGNVGINVLLTLLSNHVLFGFAAFLFSTVFITVFGEIVPQAYFSRHALKTASVLLPLLKLYQIVLYPFAKPTALLLDRWLGHEGMELYKEQALKKMIGLHLKNNSSEIDKFEGVGALNFLSIDDISIIEEGEVVDPLSIISLPFENDKPIFPVFTNDSADPFLRLVQKSGKKWVIVTDESDKPYYALDVDIFLREVLFSDYSLNPIRYCHKPIIVYNPLTPLEEVITKLKVKPQRKDDDVIDEDVILLWSEKKKVITGSDILGRLLRGIARISV